MNDENTEIKWWQEGLVFGFLMFIGISVIFPLISGEGLVLKQVLIGIPIWVILGLCAPLLRNALQSKKK